MMVVGDSAARAFGIFAAASLVRFRTNIRDPKETTVLLVCLGVGLAAGVGRWDMAIILTVFVLLSLSVLEYFEQYQVFRSMEVAVQTRDVDKTNDLLKRIFARHRYDYELRELNRQDADEPLGVRVSAAVFGLSAMRDMGIGQIPKRIAPHVHALYTMTYPSLFAPGELGLADPSAAPGATVARALKRFRRAIERTDALLLPWVQDFSFTVPYGRDEVRAQIYAARVGGAKGYLLWNAEGVYTDGTLTPAD